MGLQIRVRPFVQPSIWAGEIAEPEGRKDELDYECYCRFTHSSSPRDNFPLALPTPVADRASLALPRPLEAHNIAVKLLGRSVGICALAGAVLCCQALRGAVGALWAEFAVLRAGGAGGVPAM